MREFIVAAAVCLALVTPAAAGETQRTVRQSPFVPGQYDVLQDGRRVGIVRQNPFLPGQFDVYDSGGRRTETVRQNPFVDGEWTVEPDGPQRRK
jgi:hypothetical protein